MKRRTNLTISEEARRLLTLHAKRSGTSVSGLIERLIRDLHQQTTKSNDMKKQVKMRTFTYNKTETVTVKWTHDDRDSVTVTGAKNPAQAWDAAEDFLTEISQEDETTNYCTGLPGSEYIEESEDGVYVFRVKADDK